MPPPQLPKDRDRPWVMRTYAGHSSPVESNALYRRNLAKGQTGLSVLSGSHLQVVPAVLSGLREAGLDDVPVVVGGIIPDGDARRLREQGVARVLTPEDFGLDDIMGSVVDVVREANGLAERVPART